MRVSIFWHFDFCAVKRFNAVYLSTFNGKQCMIPVTFYHSLPTWVEDLICVRWGRYCNTSIIRVDTPPPRVQTTVPVNSSHTKSSRPVDPTKRISGHTRVHEYTFCVSKKKIGTTYGDGSTVLLQHSSLAWCLITTTTFGPVKYSEMHSSTIRCSWLFAAVAVI